MAHIIAYSVACVFSARDLSSRSHACNANDLPIFFQARLFTNRRGSQKHTIKRVPRVHVKDWDAPANAPYRLGRTAFVLEGALPPTGAYAESAFAAWNASFFINRYPHEVVDHYSTNMARFFPLFLYSCARN